MISWRNKAIFRMVILSLLLISAGSVNLFARQGITVSGKITDSSGSLPGVNVRIKGTTIGVVTDVSGAYSITVPDGNAVLQYSFVGYAPQEITVGDRRTIDVELAEDTKELEEVVVVGYGTQKRGSITGSITSVNSEVIEDVAVANLSNALAGRLSGVAISSTTSRPGSSSSFNIRSQGTINNADPLFVIDGVVSSKEAFDALDASEVENISILKDGASAAIYGSRSANGVVLVSTKKGVTGKPVINYSGSVAVSDAVGVPEVMTAYEHATYQNDAAYIGWRSNPDRDPNADPSVLQTGGWFTQDELDHFKTTDYWALEDEWRRPVNTRHVLNVTGGTEAVKYFVGGSYIYNKGSFDNLHYNRYTFRASVDAKITENLSAALNIGTNIRQDQKPFWPSDGGESSSTGTYNGSGIGQLGSMEMHDLYKGLLLRTRMIPAYIDGLPVASDELKVEQHAGMNISEKSGGQSQKWNMMNINAQIRYNIPFVKGLQASLQFSRNTNNRLVKQVDYPYTMYWFKPAGKNSHYINLDETEVIGTKVRANANPNFIRKTSQLTQSYQLNAFLRYSNTFGKHAVDGVLSYEQYERFFEMFDAERKNLISYEIPEFFAANPDVTNSVVGSGNVSEDARVSYIGRVNYAFDNKYLLEAVLRIDGSVKFAPSERWGYFPSVSAGWVMSSEDFFKDNIGFISFFKLRGSLSNLGNDAVGGWQWMPRYNIVTGNSLAVFEDVRMGIQSSGLANPYLTWEKSTSYNIGFDSRMLKNRLGISFEYFTRRTTDILDERKASVPTTFGATMPKENYATIGGKGVEIEANWRDKAGQDVTYNLFGNFGWAKSWWIKRDEALNLRSYLSEIGQPIGRVFGFEYTDIIRTEADAQTLRDNKVTVRGNQVRAGMLMYKDIRSANNETPDGIITDDDKVVIIEHVRPRFTYGFGAGLKWKLLSADIFFQGLGGHQKENDYKTSSVNAYTNQPAWKNDHWTYDNTGASQPSPQGNQNGQKSSFWIRDASFLRCKLATISCDLPKQWLAPINLTRARVFVQGTNLFLFKHDIYWMDPEASRSTDYPVMREFTFGVNITL